LEWGEETSETIIKSRTKLPQVGEADQVINGMESCSVVCDQGCTYPGECRRYIDENGNDICDLTECTEIVDSQEITEDQTEPQTPSSAETDPELFLDDPGECTVLCPKGCSYPGQCQDYRDENGNGLCDLGECLASNLAQQDTADHKGGGGHRRRGN
jgi:hypothetical protein